jgi:uncharacterized protein (DUF1778 family)
VGSNAKTSQLQIRVAPAQKAELARRARAEGMDLSSWVLSRLLPQNRVLKLDALSANQLAAMVETRAARLHVRPPKWVSEISPLEQPWFPTTNMRQI